MGQFAEAWRVVHNFVASADAFVQLRDLLKLGMDAEAEIERVVRERDALVASVDVQRAELDKLSTELTAKAEDARVELAAVETEHNDRLATLNVEMDLRLRRFRTDLEEAEADHKAKKEALQDDLIAYSAQATEQREALNREIEAAEAKLMRIRDDAASIVGGR